MEHATFLLLIAFQLCNLQRVVRCCSVEDALEFKGSCYKFHGEKFTKYIADGKCRDAAGHLAVAADNETSQFLLSKLARDVAANGSVYWIELKNGALLSNNGQSGNSATQIKKAQNFSCHVLNGSDIFDYDCDSYAGYICTHPNNLNSGYKSCPEGSVCSKDRKTCFWKIPHALPMFGKPGELSAREACALSNGTHVGYEELLAVHSLFVGSFNKTISGDIIWVDIKNNADSYNGSAALNKTGILEHSSFGTCHAVDFNTDKKILQVRNCSHLAYPVCKADKTHLKSPLVLPSAGEVKRERKKRFSFLECPHGYNWKEDTSTGYCYWETSYETSRLSWAEARRYCQSYGGDLASFHSRAEEVIGLSFQYGSLIHPYWIGLIYEPKNNTYMWTDGSPVNYTNWAPDQPDHRFGRMRCVQMHASEKHWIVSYCGMLSWFVCKAPKQYNPKVPELPKQEPIVKCLPESAGYFFNGYCYAVPRVSHSWARANAYCRNLASQLVSIHTEEELDFLIRLLYEFRTDGNAVWIGLHATSADSPFKWTDGTVLDFVNWDLNEPNGYYNLIKCSRMNVNNGLWNDSDCSETLPFICKWKNSTEIEDKLATTLATVTGHCKNGWFKFGNSCYFLAGTKQLEWENWDNASRACQSLGGQLASVSSEKEHEVLAFLLQYIESNSWIGLHSSSFEPYQLWTDGNLVDYTKWAPMQPESVPADKRACVEMVYKNSPSGLWKVEDCNKRQAYICETSRDPAINEPSPQPKFMRCIHPKDWTKMGSSCFMMFTTELSWHDARRYCNSLHAELISITDSSIRAIARYLALDVESSFWIGLIMNADWEFQWINNQSLTFSAWGYYQPNLTATDSVCFSSTANGYWNVTQCSQKMPFICQINGGPDSTATPTEDEIKCPMGYYDGGGDYCYYFDRDNFADWHSASFMCFSRGDNLASFHSAKEIERLQNYLYPADEDMFPRNYYIGLVRDEEDHLAWSDESPVDFVNWIGVPHSNNDEKCNIIVGINMKWEPVACTNLNYFVCGKEKAQIAVDDFNISIEYAHVRKDVSAGLSGGALAAVVVLLLLAIVIGSILLYFHIRSGDGFPFRIFSSQQERVMSFENALFNPDAGMELCHKRLETESED